MAQESDANKLEMTFIASCFICQLSAGFIL